MSVPAPSRSSPLTPAPTGVGGRGALQAPQTESGAGTIVSRTVRVPLERPDDAGWKALVSLAREGAQFANGMIASWWAEAHGWKQADESAFVAFKGALSGDVRVAIAGEAKGVWQRVRARVLRRDQRVPAFASDRALVVRGQYAGGKGGVRIVRTAEDYEIRLRLVGQDVGPIHVLTVWSAAVKRDRYLSGLLDQFASGAYRVSKVTVALDLRRRKLYAHVAYDRPVGESPGVATCVVGPMMEDGQSCLVRTSGSTLDITRFLWEIRTKKAHYDGIVRRLRTTIGRGPGWRRAYRRVLPPTYDQWAMGKLHQISARVIRWAVEQKAGVLRILPLGDGDWPAHRFAAMLRYKAEQAGLHVDLDNDATSDLVARAMNAPVKKDLVRAGKVRRAAQTLRHDLGKE